MTYAPSDGDRMLPRSKDLVIGEAMIVASVPFFSQFLQLYICCICSRTTAFAGMISTSRWILLVISWSLWPHTGQSCSSSVSTYSTGSVFLKALIKASFFPFRLILRTGHAFSAFGSGNLRSASFSISLKKHSCCPSSIKDFSLFLPNLLAWLRRNIFL